MGWAAGGFADSVGFIKGLGWRCSNYVLSCSHYQFYGIAIRCGAVTLPDSDAAAQDTLNIPSVEGSENGW